MKRRVSTRALAAGILLVALILAGVVSFYAATSPDGLTKVSEKQGFDSSATPHASDDSPFAGYGASFIHDGRLSKGASGVVGVLVVLALGTGLTYAVRRRTPESERGPDRASTSASMGDGHGHKLHFHGHSPIHRAPAHLKVLALLAFVLVVVATPREWYPVFGGYAAVVAVVIGISRVPPTYILKRMVVEVPFLFFALLLPFVATGPRTDVLGVSVSEHGLLGAWGLLVKGTLGVLASLTLAATTEPQDLLHGLERLHLPQQLVQIMGFMVRYLDVVTAEMQRMRIARESRGFSARNPTHWPVLARSMGALFIRSYERGERVHLAMLSRGYTGKMPR